VTAGVSRKVVQVDGLSVSVLVKANPQNNQSVHEAANPLLILNGIGTTVDTLVPLLDLLDGRDVIAFDIPDTKKANKFHMGWRMKHYARLTKDLLDKLGYSSVNILGYSWGGALAQEFVNLYPEYCDKLILAATSPGHIMVPGRVFFSPKKFKMRSLWSPQALANMVLTKHQDKTLVNESTVSESKNQVEFSVSLTTPRIYIQQTLALMGWSSLGWLRNIKVKTLVVHAKDDLLVSKINASILSFMIPKATLHLVEDGGHIFPFYHRIEFKTIISKFLLA